MKLWYGKECEGGLKGTNTLFIGSPDITMKDIREAIYRKDIHQFYFGAGGCTTINNNIVKLCLKKYKLIILTLEVSLEHLNLIENKLLSSAAVNIIVNIKHQNIRYLKYKSNISIKIESPDSKILHVGILSDFITTDTSKLEGKKYKGDKVLI